MTNLHGISLSSAEFGTNALPGVFNVNYTYPGAADFAYIAGRGYGFVRVPVRWERLQPTRNAPLDPAELGRLMSAISAAGAAGMPVLVDIHNYARYITSTGTTLILGSTLPIADLVDFWTRLSVYLSGNSNIWGYGLMNEPNTLVGGAATWESAAQQVVTAIRANGDHQRIVVAGYDWSSARFWPHPNPFITDPVGKIVYEAHYYLDNDHSGAYTQSYAITNGTAIDEGYGSLANRARAHVQAFTDWCAAHGAAGLLGEIGWPHDESAALWNDAAQAVYDLLDEVDMPRAYWGAGSWWGPDNKLSAYSDVNGDNHLDTVRAQATVAEPPVEVLPPVSTAPAELLDYQFELQVVEDAAGVAFGKGRGMAVDKSGFDPGAADPRVQDADHPNSDGTMFGRDYRGGQSWTWELYTESSDTPEDALDLVGELAAAWQDEDLRLEPGRMAALRYRIAGRVRRIYGRPRRWADKYDDLSAGLAIVTADFQRADPLHYDDLPDSVKIGISPTPQGGFVTPIVTPLTTLKTGGDRDGQIVVGGNAKAYPIIRIDGPISQPYVSCDAVGADGWTLKLNTTLSTGHYVVVDTRPWARTVIKDGSGSLAGALSRISRLDKLRLKPGAREITFGGVDPTGTANVTVSWRKAWSTL